MHWLASLELSSLSSLPTQSSIAWKLGKFLWHFFLDPLLLSLISSRRYEFHIMELASLHFWPIFRVSDSTLVGLGTSSYALYATWLHKSSCSWLTKSDKVSVITMPSSPSWAAEMGQELEQRSFATHKWLCKTFSWWWPPPSWSFQDFPSALTQKFRVQTLWLAKCKNKLCLIIYYAQWVYASTWSPMIRN